MIGTDNQIEKINKILLEINFNNEKFLKDFNNIVVSMRFNSFIGNFLQRNEQEQRRIVEQAKYELKQKKIDELNWELKNVFNSFDGRKEELSSLFISSFEQNKIDEDEADLIHFIKTKSHLFLKNTKKKVFPLGSFYFKSFLFQKNSSVQNICRKVIRDFRFYYFSYGV